MSALAQYFHDQGVVVTGSDRSTSPVTELLEKKGIHVVIGQKAGNVPQDAELIVYSDSVPENNPERTRAKELGILQKSYFAMLGEVSKEKKTIAVAGTHGKTTTTGMLAKILKDAGASPTAVVGSIVKDFGSNYLSAQAGLHPSTPFGAGGSNLFVVEACEYKDHLLELSPHILVITNLEWDHTDYFPSLQALQATFQKAIERVPADGAIITNPNNPNIMPLLSVAKCKVIDYAKEPAYELRLPGEFNQMNARAAAAAARYLLETVRHSVSDIGASLSSFQGTWRRFEYKGKTARGTEVYDDYAHHPTAVRETLKALRAKVSGKIYVAFHPHLYSRTRDLLNEFSTAFADADEVLIAPIYAAREVDDGTISSDMLAKRISESGTNARAATFEEIEKILSEESGPSDVIMTMGAGDIYKVADALIKK